MGFLSLLVVASMPVLQLLLIGSLGAFLASGKSSIFSVNVRRDMNKIVFAIFSPALVFSSLAKTITFHDLISSWFMPVNIAITFFIGGTLGWVAVKILRPPRHHEGLIMSCCSAGNLGNLMLMIIPAVCSEAGSPFGDQSSCGVRGRSYVALSMAQGGLFIWTHTYSLMKRDGVAYETLMKERLPKTIDDNENSTTSLQDQPGDYIESGEASNVTEAQLPPSTKSADESPEQTILEPLLSNEKMSSREPFWKKVKETFLHLGEELMEPPTVAAVVGFIIGAIPWLKSLIIGGSAPLRVIQDSLEMLGDGTLPCTTLILGGNLIRGLNKSAVKSSVLLAIALVRYVALPLSGIVVVKAAGALGFLPQDSLFSFVLLTQFTLPPAVSIGTMAQLFGVGQEESSVIFLWTYLGASLALTIWSTVFMYIVS